MTNLEDSVKFAEKAIEYDKSRRMDAAIYYYGQAAEAILNAIKANQLGIQFRSKAEEYIDRAETLKRLETATNLKGQAKTEQQLDLERADFLLRQAFNEEEEKNIDEAVDLYVEAVDLCLKAKKNTDNVELQKKLSKLAANALERAEELKKIAHQAVGGLITSPDVKSASVPNIIGGHEKDSLFVPLDNLSLGDQRNKSSPSLPRKMTAGSYSKEELDVLRLTSVINGREYVPFMSVDLREKFAYPVPYT